MTLFSSRLTKYRTVTEGSCGQCARTCSLCCTPGLAEGPCRDRCTRRCPCAQNECGSRRSNLPHTVFRLLILVRTCGLYSHILRHGCSEPPCMTNAGEIQAKVLLHHTPPHVNSRPELDNNGFLTGECTNFFHFAGPYAQHVTNRNDAAAQSLGLRENGRRRCRFSASSAVGGLQARRYCTVTTRSSHGCAAVMQHAIKRGLALFWLPLP